MKYLALLLLAGCVHAKWTDSIPAKNPAPPPVMVARGTDGDIDWKCELNDLNDSLAWVQCDFHDRSPFWLMTSACINVSFFDQATGKLVVESREICSGPLLYNGNSTNYAAFQKENRVTLRKCGESLDLCVMLAGPEKE